MPLGKMKRILIVVFSLVALTQCVPVVNEDSTILSSVIGNFVNCINSDLNLCLKEHALKAVERITSSRKLELFDGLTYSNNNPRHAKSFENLSTDTEERKKQITERLLENTNDLIQNGELELTYGGSDESRAIDDVDEGRGKKKKLKKKLKVLLPLALLLKAKAFAIITVSIGVIAYALVHIALLAKVWLISKIVEKLKGHLGSKSTAWQPEHTEHVFANLGSGGWDNSLGYSRSLNEANDLAYSTQKKN